MSAVSIIAMKMSGAVLSRSGSMDSFGEPPPGIEMLSTPPATMQSAPADRIELAATAVPEIAVFDIFLVDAGARDRVLDRVGRQGHRWGNVEPAPPGFRQTC